MPVPVPESTFETFSARIPPDQVAPSIFVEFVSAAQGGLAPESRHEGYIADAQCLEAGARAEADGCAAVCINAISVVGVAALRSRETIPLEGPTQSTDASQWMRTGLTC